MIQITRMVTVAFAHALLISLVFRVVLIVALVVVLEEWSSHGRGRTSTDSHRHTRGYRENPGTLS
jgi:uncharacterized membrane protein